MPSERRPPAAQPGSGERLSDADRRRLEARGISEEQLMDQLERLRRPAPHVRLLRPCRLADGIRTIEPAEEAGLLARWRRVAAEGRLEKLVPASGAASRMFGRLRARSADPPPGSREVLADRIRGRDEDAAAVLRLLDEMPRLPFAGELERLLAARGHDLDGLVRAGAYVPILDALLGDEGLGYGGAPKALVAFHRYPWGSRSPFVEHLSEAAGYLADAGGRCRLHFTVASGAEAAFRAAAATARRPPEQLPDLDYRVELSCQEPATDTVAIDGDGRLLRTTEGRLLLRPAGHGALLDNLRRLHGELVLVQNIDNVVPRHRQEVVIHWRRLLVGLTVAIEEELQRLRRQLADSGSAGAETVRAALGTLRRLVAVEPPPGLDADGAAAWLRSRLRRPLRVCGVVATREAPGGGPFWLGDDEGGAAGQIVEPPEVDRGDPEQEARWQASTHFNPVNMVLALRDAEGRPHRLESFVDPRRYLVTARTHEGRPLRALERPGLWNGSMAGWNTAFVELPASTFNPVKTVFDLLRPEHQAEGGP